MSDHERQLIGAMLASSSAIDDATPILTAADFAEIRHELIFAAIAAQVADGEPVEPVTIGDRLGQDIGRAGGRTYLAELAAGVVAISSAGWHAERIRDAARLRKVREVGARLEALADIEVDPLEVVNAARAELDALLDVEVSEGDISADVYAALDTLDEPIGVKTPWRDLSSLVGGWGKGMLYIVGARPGVGKTVLGIGTVLDMARRDSLAVMFSLEMPKRELLLRMCSAVGSVDGERILHRATQRADDEKMAVAAAHIARLPLVIDDRSAMSLAQMRARVRSEQRRRAVGLVVVDYLGLVKPPADAPRNDRRVQVDAIAQGLKNLARDLDVPVIALAQLNRGIEGRADKAPTLADLRESGGIEAAADVVLLMHRATSAERGDTSDLQLTIAKNRHGPQSLVRLTFEGAYSRAVDRLTTTDWRAS